MKSKVIVIGIGNEFRQDDGVGIHIARGLAARRAGRIRERKLDGVCVAEYQGAGADLMERWQGYETVVLFDAVSSAGTPGTIHRFVIPADTLPRESFFWSTHAVSLGQTIDLAKTLKRLPRKLIIYGIEGKSFDHGPGISPQVKDAAQRLVEEFISCMR